MSKCPQLFYTPGWRAGLQCKQSKEPQCPLGGCGSVGRPGHLLTRTMVVWSLAPLHASSHVTWHWRSLACCWNMIEKCGTCKKGNTDAVQWLHTFDLCTSRTACMVAKYKSLTCCGSVGRASRPLTTLKPQIALWFAQCMSGSPQSTEGICVNVDYTDTVLRSYHHKLSWYFFPVSSTRVTNFSPFFV